jgi:outer membrane lipoprotein-sorting protein
MKKTLLAFLLLVISFSLSASLAWKAEDKHTADEIINDYITAMGGSAKLASITNIYMEGEVNINGSKRQTRKWIVNKKAMRNEFTFNGITSYTIVRTDSGWNYSPNRGRKKPEPLTAASIASNQPNLDIEGPLVNYKAKGYKVTYEGTDEIEGTEAYKLEAKLNDSLTKTFYIDPDSHYIMRVRTKSSMAGRVTNSATDYSDYTKTADGYIFPMESGNVKYTLIKVNTDINDNLFKPTTK